MKIIDITVDITADIPVWDGDTSPEFTEEKTVFEQGTIQTTTIHMNVHTGTHVDAPRHFFQDGNTAPEISLDTLIGACQVLEISIKSGCITKQDLISAGFLPGTIRVLIKTVNSQLWSQEKQFQKDYIALAPSAADYLVEQGVGLIGIDYLSIAPFSNVWDVHQILLSHKVVILEGVNLETVESGVYKLICLPMKLGSKDGLPVRAILVK